MATALVTGLALLWWPQPGAYRPIQAYEGSTLTQAVPASSRNSEVRRR